MNMQFVIHSATRDFDKSPAFVLVASIWLDMGGQTLIVARSAAFAISNCWIMACAGTNLVPIAVWLRVNWTKKRMLAHHNLVGPTS